MSNELQIYDARQRLAYWTDVIRRCRNSSLTVRGFCEQEGIREKTYYYWQRKIFLSTCRENEFVEISGSFAAAPAAIAEVSVNGITAIVRSGADAATLQNLIAAMKQC